MAVSMMPAQLTAECCRRSCFRNSSISISRSSSSSSISRSSSSSSISRSSSSSISRSSASSSNSSRSSSSSTSSSSTSSSRSTVKLQATSASTLAAPTKEVRPSELELMEDDYYRMGYLRHVRAFGIHFMEGPNGVGVYAAKDMTNIERPRVILEVPMEILVTVSKDLPWMFFPDIVPMGHPIFDVINATDPESEYDIRLACLLLLALEQENNFWRLYGDYLPNKHESTDLLLATDNELMELQDTMLAQRVVQERVDVEETWKQSFTAKAPLKVKRLAPNSERLKWAVGIARSRSFRLRMTIGAKVQDADILAPYADMLNHSFEPNCYLRWRESDRVLEVVVRVGQTIKEGDEMTLNYMPRKCTRDFMHRYGFSSAENPWGVIRWSGRPTSKVHQESFFSALHISGMPQHYYYDKNHTYAHGGAVALAAARMLPMWSREDYPMLPSREKRAIKELQDECLELLHAYPTTYEQDAKILANMRQDDQSTVRCKAAVKYRMDEKDFITRVQETLDEYLARLVY